MIGAAARLRWVADIEVEIARDIEIHIAVTIVVAESRAGVPAARLRQAGGSGRVGEGPVTVVSIENVGTEISDEQVRVSVVIVISHDAAKAPALSRDARRQGHIGECSVAIVPEQIVASAGRHLFPLKLFQCGAVDQVEVGMAVVVEVEPAGAASIHFEDIIFLAAAGNDNRSHSGLPRDVGEDNGRRRRHRKSNQQGQAAEKKETKERRRLHGGSGD